MGEHYLKNELFDLIKSDDSIFEFIQSGSLDGLWYWDLNKPEHEWMSPRFWETLGYDPECKAHLTAEWQDMIFPEDLEVAIQNFKKHCKDPSHSYDQLVRYKHKNGSTVWIKCRGLAVRDELGKPIRMLGAHTDVTSIVRAKEQYEQLFQNCPNGLIVLDEECNIVQLNAKARELLMIGQSLVKESIQHYVDDDVSEFLRVKSKALQSHKGNLSDTEAIFIAVPNPTAEVREVQAQVIPIFADDVWHIMLSLQDTTEHKRRAQVQVDLISMINHELRTPLTSIMGSVSLLSHLVASGEEEQQRELLDIVERNCEKLNHLVDDILDTSKLEGDGFELHKCHIEFGSFISDCVSEAKGYAQKFNVALSVLIDAEDVKVFADKFRISQVLTNLISNAIKYSPPNSEVVVKVKKETSNIKVDVIDQGPGVSEEFKPQLFERFAQSTDTYQHKASSTGLGLYISRLIVRAHGGEIGHSNLESGSCFYFTIPLDNADSPT